MTCRRVEVEFVQEVSVWRTIEYDPDEETEEEAIDRGRGRVHDEVIEADGDWQVENITRLTGTR